MAIVVTGAAGFIGSCLVSFLNQKGRNDLILVDDFSRSDKERNLTGKQFIRKVERDVFLETEDLHGVEAVFHIGARTDTTEFDTAVFDALNLHYSQAIWQLCAAKGIPLIYASSAATYGDGSLGFDDDPSLMEQLKPLNPYGQSKQDFDLWAMRQDPAPPFWCGLKFFNVYGPNEYHKGRMASVVLHAFKQIREHGKLRLFRSHRPDYADGAQRRDFIYVKDLLELIWFWFGKQEDSGVYNAGTGQSRTFLDLAKAIFAALELPENIEFIPTPVDIRDTYQYYTQADMQRTVEAGFDSGFRNMEEGVSDYVLNYLKTDSTF